MGVVSYGVRWSHVGAGGGSGGWAGRGVQRVTWWRIVAHGENGGERVMSGRTGGAKGHRIGAGGGGELGAGTVLGAGRQWGIARAGCSWR